LILPELSILSFALSMISVSCYEHEPEGNLQKESFVSL